MQPGSSAPFHNLMSRRHFVKIKKEHLSSFNVKENLSEQYVPFSINIETVSYLYLLGILLKWFNR